ncbi:MAG: hypothetical protein ACX94D_01135 [Henriciella sp.]
MRRIRIVIVILTALAWCNGCARESGKAESRNSNETRQAALDLEAELFAQAFDEAKAKREASAEPDDTNLTLELLNESLDEDAPQAPSGGDLGLGAPPLNDARVTAPGKVVPTGQSQMTVQEREDAISNAFSGDGLRALADVNRSPECVALTNAIIGGKTDQEIYDYLLGRAELDLGWEQQNPLRDCAMKKDGLSILVLVLDRIENDWVYGPPSPEWLLDALLIAGEYGAVLAGPLADEWIRDLRVDWISDLSEERYIDNELFFRLTNSERISRLKRLVSFSDERQAGIDDIVVERGDIRTLIKDQQNECWQTQQTYRSYSESEREKYENVLQEAAPQQEATCSDVGIEILFEGPLPHHEVHWAEGVEGLSFRSGNGLVVARDVARLFDNWQKARSKNNWNSEYASFVHFSDDSKTQYIAGYDPYPHRYGDTMHYSFRVLRIDFGVYREFLSAYWAPYSDLAYAREHPIEDAREDVKKILLAIEPGIHFLLGHYEEEGMWTWTTLEDALRHPTIYAQSKPFHEYEAMIADALK